jgi:glycosyltransferase involved in cell wall biosynthesis
MVSDSVVVTAHNCAGLIARALRSVEASLTAFRDGPGRQAGAEAEVVVVDDGSTDDTPRQVADFTAGRNCWSARPAWCRCWRVAPGSIR